MKHHFKLHDSALIALAFVALNGPLLAQAPQRPSPQGEKPAKTAPAGEKKEPMPESKAPPPSSVEPEPQSESAPAPTAVKPEPAQPQAKPELKGKRGADLKEPAPETERAAKGPAQIDESKLTLKPEQMQTDPAQLRAVKGKDCCDCANNILKDGGFEKLTTAGGIGNVAATSTPWTINTLTPQWMASGAVCNKGVVSMWGNKTVFESLKQSPSPFVANKYYKGKFMARFVNPTANCNYVRLQISIGTTVVHTSIPIPSTNWACYTIPTFQAPAGANVVIQPTNQYSQNDGAFVSWIQLDSICIEEACNCDALAKEFKIEGVSEFCKPTKCDSVLTYTGPKLDGNCYTYKWTTTPELKFNGQESNNVTIPCEALKDGTYKIELTITCDKKSISRSRTLVVCSKPDPSFSMSSDGTGLNVSTTIPGNHQWDLIEDNDNNCSYSNGDIVVNATAHTGMTTSFTNLVNNKQYIVVHNVNSSCSEKLKCHSLQAMCFKWLPASYKIAPGTTPKAVAVKEISKIIGEGTTQEEVAKHWSYPRKRPPQK